MYYAYFTGRHKKVYLYDYLDKQLQGELPDGQSGPANIDRQNIYKNNKTKTLLHQYLASLFETCSAANDLIVRRNPYNNYVDDFLKNIRKILPNETCFEDQEYQQYSWQIKKQLFLGDESSPYFCMVKNMRKLFYCLGEVGLSLPFPSVYAYITNLLREDYKVAPKGNTREIKATAAKVKSTLNKIDVSKDFMLRIQLCSLQEDMSIQNINNQFDDISSRLIDGSELFQHLCKDRENLLKHICSVYYLQGMEIYKNHLTEQNGTKKHPRGFQIQKDKSEICLCPVCNEKMDTAFSIQLINDRQNTLITTCSICFTDIANKLVIEASSRFSSYRINKQLMVMYENHQFPINICDCCGCNTSLVFTILSAQNHDFKVCKDCFMKLVDKANPKNTKKK